MKKLENNRSIISCLVAAFNWDRQDVEEIFSVMIKNKKDTITFSEWTDKTLTNLGSLERKYWSKDGGVMRKMSVNSFLKKYNKGQYLVRLDNEMIFVKNGFLAIGSPKGRSTIQTVLQIN